jgi:hypothetical protein
VLAIVRGDPLSARRYLTEAFDISRKLGDPQNLAECMGAIGALASHGGHNDMAARLWGIAEALPGSSPRSTRPGLPRHLLDRRIIVHYRSRCREILGGTAYDAAVAAGRALSREAAIDEALAWLRMKPYEA